MTVTTAETLTAGGVVLNTLAMNIESLTGRLTVAPIRTDNLLVPGRHGRLRTTTKYYEEGQITLPMWVLGCDANGGVPSDPRSQFYTNLDTLTSLFRPGDGMVDLVHTLPDLTQREALCEVTDVIDFSSMAYGVPYAKFSVAMRVPDAFWQEPDLLSITLPANFSGQITQLTGTTAPIVDSIFEITGPTSNIVVESLFNGSTLENQDYFTYTGSIPAGKTLTVNCGTWQLTGSSGFTPNYADFSHNGPPRWLTLVAGLTGFGPELEIVTSGSTGATKVVLQARRKFLVG
jgi:hypothetical protein